MAVGDTICDNASVTASGYMTIQPGAGVEWIIHNITWPNIAVEVSTYDGTNECVFHTDTTRGGLLQTVFHLTNTDYMRVKNAGGTTQVFHYDGVISK